MPSITTVTVAWVPAALTDGGFSTVIPSGDSKLTVVAASRLVPLMVRVKLFPTVCRIGVIEAITGRAPRWKRFPSGAATATWPAAPKRVMVRGDRLAVPSAVISAVRLVPSGDAAKLPSVTPVSGITLKLVTRSSPTPVKVTVTVLPGSARFGSMDWTREPTATPTGRERIGVYRGRAGAAGAGGSTRTPTATELTGP